MSELEIIKMIRQWNKNIGDDCAKINNNQIITTDSFIMDEDFGDYFTPYDMGYKSMSASISDIAACGGTPTHAVIAIGMPSGDKDFISKFYKGVNAVAKNYNIEIVGGDTSKSKILFVVITVIGKVKKFIGRGNAKLGNIICVTGDIGKGYAGLLALKNKNSLSYSEQSEESQAIAKIINKHLHPEARIKEGIILSDFATAMIDISDGLLIDLSHILEESGVGAKINKSKIPISEETKKLANILKDSPLDYALYGGEDYELLFTIPKNLIKEAKKQVNFTEIGEIIEKDLIDENNQKVQIKGFDHFI